MQTVNSQLQLCMTDPPTIHHIHEWFDTDGRRGGAWRVAAWVRACAAYFVTTRHADDDHEVGVTRRFESELGLQATALLK